MIFLKKFDFTPIEVDEGFCGFVKSCYDTVYPFNFISKKVDSLEFEPLTILYGGNGSGKTTILNIIAEHLKLERKSAFNQSSFFDSYISFCKAHKRKIPNGSRIVTSDDVFDYMLGVREINEKIDEKREELLNDAALIKYKQSVKMNSMEDYEALKEQNLIRRKSLSQYARMKLTNNFIEGSNGESALAYFSKKVDEYALYLLDEPENSLSAENQVKLASFLFNACRFFNCQIVIATHSPFLLSIPNAKVYDVDETPIIAKKWTQLGNIKTYYNFFKSHLSEFEDDK